VALPETAVFDVLPQPRKVQKNGGRGMARGLSARTSPADLL
jgi:hypothetical protein